MSLKKLDADYLIVGAGAVGMAFADTLLDETDASIIIVDRHHQPGGHWNQAYPFVTLHQPSSYYGVSSLELSNGRIDKVGLNKGLNDLASGAEVSAYFNNVMRHHFLPSGRVQYFPMCRYSSDNNFESMLSASKYSVSVNKKTVDATYLNTTIPLTHTPSYSWAKGIKVIPPNGLPDIESAPSEFVIVGGGKTGIDTCLWLLENHVDPEHIKWIMPRDSWFLDRRNTQATEEFFEHSMGAQAAQMEAIAGATSIEDMFNRLEDGGYFLRLDKTVRPTTFRGATISQSELEELRRIKSVLRKGRVKEIKKGSILLERGEVVFKDGALFVDCSASAITNFAIKPVFSGNTITPQTVRSYQPAFSASFIAHVEAKYNDEDKKNTLCNVVPLPHTEADYLRLTAAFMLNQYTWSQEPELQTWIAGNRLDGFSRLVRGLSDKDTEKKAILARLRNNAMPAMAKLQEFIAQTGAVT